MRYGIIDIGSNTIRMVICDVADGKISIIGNEREKSILIECVENDALTQKGIDFLALTLAKMNAICRMADCDAVHAFATASLRNITNSDAVSSYINQKCDVAIRIITGDEEAAYDYAGLKLTKHTLDGAALDLGGGSCQILRYSNGNLDQEASFPIGSLRMYHRFVSSVLPTPQEVQRIYSHVTDELSHVEGFAQLGCHTIYAMGGTARFAIMLSHLLTKKEKTDHISVADLKELYQSVLTLGTDGVALLEQHFPERVQSLIPGIIVLCAVCDYIGASVLETAVCGVREGYLMKEILKVP